MTKYLQTARMSAQNLTNGGIFYLLPGYLLRVVYLIPLLALWRVLAAADGAVELARLLQYTYLGAILGGLLDIHSPLTEWLYDGLALSLYRRPMTIFGHVAAQTLGGLLPFLLLFSLPMAIISPLLGIDLMPVSPLFPLSLLLCVSLGFAVDFLYASLMIRMMNARWLVYSIRNALGWVLSGSFIPFALLPWNLGELLRLLPLGSMSGAVLGVATGLSEPVSTVCIQLFWNLALWPLSALAFRKAQERLVSHGG